MKSARERAREAAERVGALSSFPHYKAMLDSLEAMFKEHVRDQRHIIAVMAKVGRSFAPPAQTVADVARALYIVNGSEPRETYAAEFWDNGAGAAETQMYWMGEATRFLRLCLVTPAGAPPAGAPSYAELAEALATYGEHEAYCDTGLGPGRACTCDFGALLSRIPKEEGAAR